MSLHVLEPEEEIAVRTRLPHYPSRETVRTTEQVMSAIGTAAPQIAPPALLRSSLLPRSPPRRKRFPMNLPRRWATATLAAPGAGRHRIRAAATTPPGPPANNAPRTPG
jgi:hypothetical protein